MSRKTRAIAQDLQTISRHRVMARNTFLSNASYISNKGLEMASEGGGGGGEETLDTIPCPNSCFQFFGSFVWDALYDSTSLKTWQNTWQCMTLYSTNPSIQLQLATDPMHSQLHVFIVKQATSLSGMVWSYSQAKDPCVIHHFMLWMEIFFRPKVL